MILSTLSVVSLGWILPVAVGLGLTLILYSHFVTFSSLRKVPGDSWGSISNLPAFFAAYSGKTVIRVSKLHEKYGTIVRIQPNHISIADDGAIPIVYGHKSGLIKSDFYIPFLVGRTNIFTTRDKTEHNRKRKYVSHAFSAASMANFEPLIKSRIEVFTNKLDEIAAKADLAPNPESQTIDMASWFHYLSFDIISDLAFGAPFGMLENGVDLAEFRDHTGKSLYVPAIKAIDMRQRVSNTLARMLWFRHFAKYIPLEGLNGGKIAAQNLGGIAYARVADRLKIHPSKRHDLLTEIIKGQEKVIGRIDEGELRAEAVSHMVAGSDTTSNSLAAVVWFVSKHPRVHQKLLQELDDVKIPEGTAVPSFASVKALPYLNNVIKETLRVHSLVGIGLPRQIPADSQGLSINGYYFPPGTVLSVPTRNMHHSKEIWGQDADEFCPERWETTTERQKASFLPFSTGPRACIGRNLAEMELAVVLVTFFKRYNAYITEDEFLTTGGFFEKPLKMTTLLTRR